MSTWRRLVVAATAAAVALGALAPTSSSQPLSAGQTPPDAGEAATAGEASGAPGQVVHSWALAPTGSTDPDEPGNRPTLSYEVAPGAVIEDAVTLFNYSNVQLNFRVYATDGFNNDDGAFDLLTGDQEPTDVGSWVTLKQETITVPARSQATIPLTVAVPADASPGDHVGAVLASSGTTGTGPDGKIVNLDRRTGSRLYLRVSGPLAPELAVESIHTSYTPALNPAGGTAEVTYRIQNRGNVRLGGSHRVSVAGPFGLGENERAAEELPELLPGEGITVHTTFEGVPASVLAFTTVRLEPTAITGDEAGAATATRQAVTFAPPVSLVALALALGFALYARRSYARHRREQRLTVGHEAL
jgi:hypothetical protein